MNTQITFFMGLIANLMFMFWILIGIVLSSLLTGKSLISQFVRLTQLPIGFFVICGVIGIVGASLEFVRLHKNKNTTIDPELTIQFSAKDIIETLLVSLTIPTLGAIFYIFVFNPKSKSEALLEFISLFVGLSLGLLVLVFFMLLSVLLAHNLQKYYSD